MSSGDLDLFLHGAGNFAASNQRSISGSCVVGGLTFFLFALSATSSFISCAPYVPLKWEGSKRTDSMRYTRVGFGVKYFGFHHINLCFVLFIFLRGALT
ncbi:hypothetical protein ZIOFF_028307 [Zingiber officinale]|uniref:Uncharacterized protein n=1 Tax=Zingiber officinale TaxID=94328 RepID=A0A8J5LEU2_ZINOF|nr:hypothetical protein ZIOFF_028307 [Zingiber officinale]